MCNAEVAGCNAETNQSLTKTAPAADAASTAIVVASDHLGGSSAVASPVRKIPSVETKTTSKTPPQIRLSVCSCAAAGACKTCANVGTERMAAARSVSVAIVLARGESNRWTPFRRPPAKNASPTFSTIARARWPMTSAPTPYPM